MKTDYMSGFIPVKILVTNVLVIFLLLITPYIANSISNKYSEIQHKTYDPFTDIKDWKFKTFKHPKADTPIINFADYAQEGIYYKGKSEIDAYVYIYSNAANGKEIIHHNNLLFDKKYWTMVKKNTVSLKYKNKNLLVNEYLVSRGSKTRIIRYFYVVNDKYIHSAYMVKIHELFVKLLGNEMDSRLYVLSLDTNEYTHSDEILNGYISALLEKLNV